MSLRGQFLGAILAIVLPMGATFAGQSPSAPRDPASLPARDQHEGLLLAVDLCADAACATSRFGKQNPVEAGILPVEVYLRNDGAEPLRIRLEEIRLEIDPATGQHQELVPLSADEVGQRIAYPAGSASPENPGTRPHVGFGLPGRDKKAEKIAASLQPLMLDTDLVGPHSTVHGFLFFDLNRDFGLIPDSSLYVPNVRTLNGYRRLTYFEVSLKAARKS
jgi:hypothetical protein